MVKPGDTVVAIHGQREECPGQEYPGIGWSTKSTSSATLCCLVLMRYLSHEVIFTLPCRLLVPPASSGFRTPGA